MSTRLRVPITFENGLYEHNRGFPSGEDGFYIQKGSYITFRNIELGPICCDNDGIDLFAYPNGVDYGVTMDHLFVHDIVTACSQLSALANWPNCSSQSAPYDGNHVDCVQTLGMGNWTVENSRILNCTGGNGAPLQQGVYWNNNTYFDLLWQNNVIDTTNFGIGCGGTCKTTYGNNYVFKATVPPGYPNSETKSYFKVLYNTLEEATGGEDMQPGGDYELIGNIDRTPETAMAVNCPSTPGEVARGRLVERQLQPLHRPQLRQRGRRGLQQVRHKQHQRPGDVRRCPRLDLHLAQAPSGSRAEGSRFSPRHDLDGRLRPLRYPTDVGAYVSESAVISFGGRLGELRLGMSQGRCDCALRQPENDWSNHADPASARSRRMAGIGAHVWVTYGRAPHCRRPCDQQPLLHDGFRFGSRRSTLGSRARPPPLPRRLRSSWLPPDRWWHGRRSHGAARHDHACRHQLRKVGAYL